MPHSREMWWRARVSLVASIAAAVLLLPLAPRAAPPTTEPSGGGLGLLYVGDLAGRAVAAVDGETGSPARPPVAVRGAPTQLVPVIGGGMLVASFSSPLSGDSHVTHIARGGTSRTIPLEPGAREVLLADQAADLAAAAYVDAATAHRCRLAILSLRLRAVLALHHVCRAGETVTSLVLGDGPQPSVYVTLLGGRLGSETYQLGAYDALDGVLRASLAFDAPVRCFAEPSGPLRRTERLYCVTPVGDLDELDFWPEASQLAVVRADTLAVERVVRTSQRLRHAAVAPGATHVYGVSATGALLAIDVANGSSTVLARLPGRGPAIAVSDRHVFVAGPLDGHVVAVERNAGPAQPEPRVVQTGIFPLAIAWVP